MPKPLMDKPWHLSVDQTDVLVLHFLHARMMKQSKDPPSIAYGIRTRDPHRERMMSWATRRTRYNVQSRSAHDTLLLLRYNKDRNPVPLLFRRRRFLPSSALCDH